MENKRPYVDFCVDDDEYTFDEETGNITMTAEEIKLCSIGDFEIEIGDLLNFDFYEGKVIQYKCIDIDYLTGSVTFEFVGVIWEDEDYEE